MIRISSGRGALTALGRGVVAMVFMAAMGGCLENQRGRVAEDVDDARADVASADTAVAMPDTTTDVAMDVADVGEVEAGPFVGGWLIDQPFHAAYEASYYRFEADGRITVVASSPADCLGHLERFCETGHVSPPDGSILCRFGGGTWEEVNPLELAITNTCDDGVERTVLLDFTTFDGEAGGAPDIVEVDGRKGWRHTSWEWFFRRCEADLQFGFEPVRCQ